MNKTLVPREIINYINNIIEIEGGYSDRENDRGGPTKFGITLPTLSTYLGRNATVEELKKITAATAFRIYENLYFKKANIQALPSDLQFITLDMAVNHGIKGGVMILQQALNTFSYSKKLVVDGDIGPLTAAFAKTCVNSFGVTDVINRICDERQGFYDQIVSNDSTQLENLHGWTNRNDSFRIA